LVWISLAFSHLRFPQVVESVALWVFVCLPNLSKYIVLATTYLSIFPAILILFLNWKFSDKGLLDLLL
jgi:hypothetical protein